MSQPTIESILQEKRLFHPPTEFSQNAHIKSLEDYQRLYDKAKADPQAFWAELAEKELHWFQKWDTVLDWQPPFREVVSSAVRLIFLTTVLTDTSPLGARNKAAIFGRENQATRALSLTPNCIAKFVQFANVLKQLGVKKAIASAFTCQ
jgi:acetyl-CoA synthetase